MIRYAYRFLSSRVVLFCICSTLLPISVVRADWGADASITTVYNNNVNNALEVRDRRHDLTTTVGLNVGYFAQLTTNTSASVRGLLEQNFSAHYSGLYNTGIGLRAQLRHKFALGSGSPWLSGSLQAIHRDYHDQLRSGWRYDAGLNYGQPLSERVLMGASIRYDSFVADRTSPPVVPGFATNAYDISGWSLGGNGTFLITPADRISLGYTLRDGTVVASTPPDFTWFGISRAILPDPVFSSESLFVAYRTNAKTDIVSLNWSHELDRRLSFNFGYSFYRSRIEANFGNYYSSLFSANIGYSL